MRRLGVVGLSLALHVSLGLLAVLASGQGRRAEEPLASVEVVFEVPSAPAQLRPADPASVPQPDTPVQTLPQAAELPDALQPEPSLPEASATEPVPPEVVVPPVQEAEAQPPPEPAVSEVPAQPAALAQPETRADLPRAPPRIPPQPQRPAPSRRQAREAPAPSSSATTLPAPAPSPTLQAARPMPPPAPTVAAIDEAWRGSLAAWVRSRQRYPEEARRLHREGAGTVRFTLGRDGQVVDAQLAQGSGSDLLDQAALAMFRGARAPPFPPDMIQQQVTITITVRWRLED